MTLYLVLMASGASGLALMAVPGLRGGRGHASHAGHATHASHAGVHAAPHAVSSASHALHFLLEPRAVFSLLALTGAFGTLFEETVAPGLAVSLPTAVVLALVVERFVLRKTADLALRFQGRASRSLELLILDEATAVTSFSNGKGIVQVLHDGRAVQLSAHLAEGDSGEPVRVGAKLRIERVDAAAQRVTVSVR